MPWLLGVEVLDIAFTTVTGRGLEGARNGMASRSAMHWQGVVHPLTSPCTYVRCTCLVDCTSRKKHGLQCASLALHVVHLQGRG